MLHTHVGLNVKYYSLVYNACFFSLFLALSIKGHPLKEMLLHSRMLTPSCAHLNHFEHTMSAIYKTMIL